MHYLTKVNPWKTAFFIAIFEFFTLLILPYIGLNSFITGFIDGFAGAVLAILIFDFISSKGFKLNIELDRNKTYLKKLPVLIPSLANGLFILSMFLVQEELVFAFRSEIINDAINGFSATFIAMVACIVLYNILIKFTKIRLKGELDDKHFKIGRIDLWRSCFFVALFELFILPLMGIIFILLQNLPYQLTYPLVGLFGGFFGSLIASFLYNLFARYFKGIGFELE